MSSEILKVGLGIKIEDHMSPLKSFNATLFPFASGSVNAGAALPSWIITAPSFTT